MTNTLDPADMAACRALLKGGSRTFHAASKVLPRQVGDPAIALYAFCRLADDAVDLGDDRAAAVERLKERLDRAYRGRPMDRPPIAPSPTSCAIFDSARSARSAAGRTGMGCRGAALRDVARAVCLRRARRRHGRRDDDAGDGATRAGDGRARLRSRRRHATDQYRPRCRRGCARRPALSAAVVAARRRDRS